MRGTVAKRLRKIAEGMATQGNEMANKKHNIFVRQAIEGEFDALGEQKFDWVEKQFTQVVHAPSGVRGTYKALKKAYKRG